ncbi:hypothetical protein F5Y16DRAFT_356681 [Xylariaceae sp. FL0255]|nr:hypothetical protein F5Y16DRAFT_356681 [Xylariaceae sp. FL0255]
MSSRTQKRPRLSPSKGTATAFDSEADESSTGGEKRWPRRKHANVYEAVAGRVTTTLPIDDSDSEDQARRKHHRQYSRSSRRDPTFAPEEVLFKRSGAPIRYAEKDIYHAHEDLRDGGRALLPDSDMLKSLHSYTSHFYASLAASGATMEENDKTQAIDERSMDETALLAFGILLEEAGWEALGKRGHLVFTEGVEVNENGGLRAGIETGDVEAFGFGDAKRFDSRYRSGRNTHGL